MNSIINIHYTIPLICMELPIILCIIHHYFNDFRISHTIILKFKCSLTQNMYNLDLN